MFRSLTRVVQRTNICQRSFANDMHVPTAGVWSVNKFFADAAQAEPISEEKFADVCKLAYLAADGEKSAMLRKDLGAMVAYVKQIQRVDKKGVKPLVSVSSPVRRGLFDEAEQRPSAVVDREELMSRSANVSESFYKVPASTDA